MADKSDKQTLALALELMGRRSVTPADDGCQELLAELLEEVGFSVEHMPFGKVSNLWARHGGDSPVLCFAGHTDVVPPGPLDAWEHDPFEPELRDGWLKGRGAADMKSGIAAMVRAGIEFARERPNHKGSLAFLITSDEEGPARDGTRRVMDTLSARDETIDWCVVGEPSCSKKLGDTLRVGRRGSLSATMTVRGEQGHVAYPALARNPIQSFAPVLAEMYATPLDQGNEHFPPTGFQVVKLHADAGATNVFPGELVTRFNFRFTNQWKSDQIKAWVAELLARHDIDYEIEWRPAGEPFLTARGPLVENAREIVREECGIDPELSTGGGTSDGRFIALHGADVVEFGVINRTIHQINERVRASDVTGLRRVYSRVMERLLPENRD
ncbi:MAG: succinyl-diaminopimelate desuccinylase [Gammaproteobacteria bacterium]|nr:succinyl-diaminopimelate desuccinylase [Gammaproteobacteria bacterium]